MKGNMDIREYIGLDKELTSEEVKKLPAGTRVKVHKFDRHGIHNSMIMTVVKSGRKKILVNRDVWNKPEMPIREETQRFCYTEVE